MKYLLPLLILAACSEPFDLSRLKYEAKDSFNRHKVVCVTEGNTTSCTLETKEPPKAP